jgi:hypothetical protein
MRRHQFVANTLASRLDVVHVWQEEKSFEPMRYATDAGDEAVIARHFDARDASEADFFASHDRSGLPSTVLPPGGCNDPAQIAAMTAAAPGRRAGLRHRAPEAAAHWTGFQRRILNIHLGLSPVLPRRGHEFLAAR